MIGGEGGIRTPDTVARMPHFECGAFNHSATSPEQRERLKRRAAYLAAAGAGYKKASGTTRRKGAATVQKTPNPQRFAAPATRTSQKSLVTARLELPAELAIERVRSAAAQRDGEAQQTPKQRVFVAAAQPAETVAPVGGRNDQQLDGSSGGEEPGEQTKDERDTGQRFDSGRGPEPQSRRREAE